jgi:Flp pilus assembly protein TadB
MDLSAIRNLFESSTAQFLLVLLAAGLAAAVSFVVASSLSLEQSTSRRLGKFAGTIPTGLTEEIGGTVLRLYGRDTSKILGNLEWAQLGGNFEGWTMATLIGRCSVFGAAGALVFFLLSPGSILFILGAAALGGYFPLLQVNGRANDVKKQLGKELPEIAALVAAELAAGNAPDVAIERAAHVPGPLGKLLARALADSHSSGRPLFSRKPLRGTLVEILLSAGLSQLTAFAAQLDLVASKGVAGADLMADISRAISREYYEHVMSAAESLEGNLVVPSAIFFFLPFTIAILLPMMTALSGAF